MNYEYNKKLFNTLQQHCIDRIMSKNVDEELLNTITTLDENGEPVFHHLEMKIVCKAVYENLSWNEIKYFCKINDNMISLYDDEQMNQICMMFIKKYNKNAIDAVAKLNDNNKPIFSGPEMERICIFIKYANKKQIEQLIESINDDLNFNQLVLDTRIPSEHMRIYRSFCRLGCSEDIIRKMISQDLNHDLSYEELKNIKYLLSCAKELDIDFEHLFNDSEIEYSSIKYNLATQIYPNNNAIHIKKKNLIFRCLNFELDKAQIAYLVNKEDNFNVKEIKTIAVGFLNGLTVEEIKSAVSNIVDTYGFRDFDSLKNKITDVTTDKFTINLDSDEKIELKTDWLDEVER